MYTANTTFGLAEWRHLRCFPWLLSASDDMVHGDRRRPSLAGGENGRAQGPHGLLPSSLAQPCT